MTFVAAKRFGERILIVSDTMISRSADRGDDIIPGRLKVVILDPKTTVAYAGLPDQSIDAIRRAKELLGGGAPLADIEQTLTASTVEHSGGEEFLLASHREGSATLKRIWDGRISASLSQASIGQRDLLPVLLENEGKAPLCAVPSEFEEEAPFSFAFRKLFSGVRVTDSVGGFGIMAICSPYGHCYSGSAGVAAWDTIRGGQPLTEQQLADRRSGMTQWGYNVSGPALRGVGVVGAVVLDAGIGFIYSPFRRLMPPGLADIPIIWRFPRPTQQREHGPLLEAFDRAISAAADEIGGGITVEFPPPVKRAPTEAELQQVRAHAAKAPHATTVQLESDCLQIRCGPPEAWNSVRVDFNALDPDPVWVLTTTIDRLNVGVAERLRQAAAYIANQHPGD